MNQGLGMEYTFCVFVLRYKMLQRDCNTLMAHHEALHNFGFFVHGIQVF